MTKEQKELAETIAKANGGCVLFNISKAAKIAGRHRNNFSAWLNERGVLVERSGKDKYINANDLAIAMTFNRESPIH